MADVARSRRAVDHVPGVHTLRSDHGRLFVVVGVFDGLHRGHLYLLRRLRREAADRGARPAVITFDHHPDEVITGRVPPLLLDPDERLGRLAAAGVEVVVVQPFDEAIRRTPYDAYVGTIRERVDLAGFLMTPDAAFGFERRGTPEALADLGRGGVFDVVVAPALTLRGRPIRSSEIRASIGAGDLATAAELLGRAHAVVGGVGLDGALTVDMPVALPPPGRFPAHLAPPWTPSGPGRGFRPRPAELRIEAGQPPRIVGGGSRAVDRVRVAFAARD